MPRLAPRPVLLMHSTADAMISVDHSRALHAAANGFAELWTPDNASHAMLYNMYPTEWSQRVQRFLRTHLLPLVE
jgi:fermentation-respiration switch protein FrsA (DUF1100 family)